MTSSASQAPATGDAFARLSWWSLLALCAITPLTITNVSFGAARGSLTYEMVNLPKLVVVIVCAGLGLAAYAIAVVRGAEKPRFHVAIPLMWALAAWSGLSAWLSPTNARAIFGDFDHNEGIVAFVAYAVVVTLAVQVVNSAARMRKLALTLGASGAVVAAYGLLQFAHLDPLAWPAARFGDRIFATFENPDMLGAFLIMPLALSIGVALSERQRSRDFWLAAVASSVIAAAIVLTLVRGAWLGAVAALVLLAFAMRGVKFDPAQRRRVIGLLASWGVAIAAAVALSFAAPQAGLSVGERVGTTVAAGSGGSLGERFATWGIALRAIAVRPVLGYSPGSFLDVFRLHADASWWKSFGHLLSERDAHNLALQYAVTLGLPGALLAIGTVLTALAQGVSAAFRRESAGARLVYASVLAGTAGIFVALLTSLTVSMVAVWLWLGVGVLCAAKATEADLASVVKRAGGIAVALAMLVLVAVGISWWRADAIAARAVSSTVAEESLAGMDAAIAANPTCHEYKVQKATLATYAMQTATNSGLPQAQLLVWADGAVAASERSWADDPEDALAAVQALLVMNARYDIKPDAAVVRRAVAAADRMVAKWPAMPDVRNEAARAYLRAGRNDRALVSARVAVRADSSFAEAWFTLGQVYLAQADEPQARKSLERAVSLDPANAQAAAALRSLGATSTP